MSILPAGRYELKYYLPFDRMSELLQWVQPYAEPDRHTRVDVEGMPRYTIRSVYLDADGLRLYQEKLDGKKNRVKFRVRSYHEPAPEVNVFLETKHRRNAQISKERVTLPLRFADPLVTSQLKVCELDLPAHKRKGAERFVYYCRSWRLRPIVTVVYDRIALIDRADQSVRLTVDVNLRCEDQRRAPHLFTPQPFEPVPLPGAILELKFNRLMPEWMRDTVRHFDLRQQSISKYCLCVDVAVLKHHEPR
jgi:hypothetical protein